MEAKERLIFPLDVSNLKEARYWVKNFRDTVGIFKIGLQFFISHGPEALLLVREESSAEIFLDLKIHDIPYTMKKAAYTASLLGADMLTVHMLAGTKAVRECVEVVEGGTKILAVTILTSHTRAELMEVGYSPELTRDLRQAVLRLANLAYRTGCYGLVCSAKEVSMVKEVYPHLKTVVPGIRPAWANERGDQARVATPYEAIMAGADYLVIGRPLREASDPQGAVQKILEEMEKAFQQRGENTYASYGSS